MKLVFAPKRTLAVGIVGALVLASSTAATASASVPPRFSSLTLQTIKAKGYEDTANTLIAAVHDSSFGPTAVIVGGKPVTTPVTASSATTGLSRAKKSKLDVDHRTERTDPARSRAQKIGKRVTLSKRGTDAVANLIDSNRAIELGATDGHPDVDIVSSTVTPTKVVATADSATGLVLVEVTSYVTEEYRSGVVAESNETTNVVFNATTGEVDAIHPVTDRELAESSTEYVDPNPVSGDGVPADTTWYPEGQVPPELGSLAHLGGSYSPTFVKAGMSTTNKLKVVAYANLHWDDHNPAYKTFDNDCTNFVSQAMSAGGWHDDLGLYNDDHNWWYNSLNQTHSWAGAENWYKFARVYSGRVTALGNVYSLRPGDVLQAKYSGSTVVNHTMIVTLYQSNMVYLTYHSNDRHNVALTWFQNQEPYSTYYAQQV